MKFINYPMLWVTVGLTTGIVTSYFNQWNFSRTSLFSSLFVLIGILIINWLWHYRKLKQGFFFGIATWLIFFSIGFTNYELRKPENNPNHFKFTEGFNTPKIWRVKIHESLKKNAYYSPYIAEVIDLKTEIGTGKILFSIQRDSVEFQLHPNNELLVYGLITEIPSPRNPNQFSYKKYLKNQGVAYQLKTASPYQLQQSDGANSLQSFAANLREYSISKLRRTQIKPKQLAILEALVLGYKKDIDAEQYRQFAAAGALHILAVSGLHVGIIFLLLSRILSPLKHLPFGKPLKSLVIIIILWGFALLAGLSPSVVRAVTMFSCFALAGMLDRPSNSLNTLLLSFFVLLLFAPGWLFHVGFQLSYAAVFFILWIQPKLYVLYRPRYQLDRLLWSIITVSLAAQIGVAPLSLYYFHQFPGLFLLTNVVILPFLSILLFGGLLIVFLTLLDLLPAPFAQSYDWLLHQLNQFISWVAQKEEFLFDRVPFSIVLLLSCYACIVTMVYYSTRKKPSYLLPIAAAITLICAVITIENRQAHKQQLLVFHSFGKTTIGYQHGREFTCFQSDSMANTNRYPLKDFILERRIQSIQFKKIPTIFSYNSEILLRIDSTGLYPTTKQPMVLLTDSPKVHLERLIDHLHPKLIIVDGSNYPSYVARWKQTCLRKKIPFYETGRQGAFIL